MGVVPSVAVRAPELRARIADRPQKMEDTMSQAPARTAIVVIGRNEGARLLACLRSLEGSEARKVYVDSGSGDGSVEAARDRGIEVVELDPGRPFTAARARNAGMAHIAEARPDFVQFVDGDCQLTPGWLEVAHRFLAARPQAVAVAGRLRERHPERSIYNRLCDAEWNVPAGRAAACGGIAMYRADAFRDAGGFREDLIAGEEPELCLRLRRAGGEIWRIDQEMGLHDAEMTRFSQWWQRARRAGYAFAEGRTLYGAGPERHYVPEVRRILLWALLLPVTILVLALAASPWALLLLAAYPADVLRLSRRVGWERALFLTLGRFAELQGCLDFFLRKRKGARRDLIEYK